ncbi:mersacidin/lichenicidin family type 2 lantibiotic [Nostoc sp. FACHB-888]|uniref:mersacidin/lichenicidin family type 2 lantibiotic n=1 Tax=Nostoc sp. FACHB-888 TaxID=2692842 RepID=UPI0016866056|nr:mersacidin/lichenicidin family type 2 lantibiotic [Nostoc sp. FACHB-888]MBD2244957.1 mersacidin/lichenicidin family type 2 lantibiotic [Nostoc sp. FACHB-888]
MSSLDIIRAWKDEDYRLSLSDSQRALLPDSPVGLVELSDLDMGSLAGGGGSSNSSCEPGKGWGKTGYKTSMCNADHKKHDKKKH